MTMTMKVTEENVLVVRRSLFDELGAFHALPGVKRTRAARDALHNESGVLIDQNGHD